MAELYAGAAGLVLLHVAVGVWRLIRGPTSADRMVTTALFGTAGVAAVLLAAEAFEVRALHDVALVLVILAATGSMVFVARRDDGSR